MLINLQELLHNYGISAPFIYLFVNFPVP